MTDTSSSYSYIGDLITLLTTGTFLYFYSSSSSPSHNNDTSKNQNKQDRFKDIIFFRKGLRFSLHEINKTFALSSLTLLSIGMTLQVVLSSSSNSSSLTNIFDRITWGGATLARFHAGYSSYEFLNRFSITRSPFAGAMWMGVITVSVLNLVSPYEFFSSLEIFKSNEIIQFLIDWGKNNYDSASLIVLGTAVAHFISMDTTIDRKREKKNEHDNNSENENRTKIGGERDFEMNLRSFGYVALGASCLAACVIAVKGMF